MSRATGVRWRILGLLVLASFISYVLRSDMSIAGPAIVEDFGLTEQQLGYILAAFTAGYTIFQFPGGVVSLKLGARRAGASIMLLWGLLIVLTAFVGGIRAGTVTVVAALIAVRFLVGAAHAPIYPLTGAVIERWFPIGSWGLPNGLSSTGLTLGSAAVAPVLAWMVIEWGWRSSLGMLSPLAFVGAAIWWWYVRDQPSQHAASNDAEAAFIMANRPIVVAVDADQPDWLRVLKNRDVLLLTLAYFCMNYIFYLMFNWVFYYLSEVRGFDSATAGIFTSVQWIAAAVGATLGGFVCDFVCRSSGMRRGCARPAAVALFLSGAFVFVGAVSGNAHVAVACLALSFLCNQITEAAFWAAGISIGGRNAAAACGVMNTGGNLAGFVNALLVPFISGLLGWTAAIVTGTVFAFISATLWLFIRADRPVPE